MKKTLNIGCGNKLLPDAVNHDLHKHREEVDIVWDLNELPWPWEDQEFDMILAHSVLEHLRITLVESVNECWRILRPGGVLQIKLPYWKHGNAYSDPTHYWQFDPRVLNAFDPETTLGRRLTFYSVRKWRIIQAAKLNNAKSGFGAKLQVRK